MVRTITSLALGTVVALSGSLVFADGRHGGHGGHHRDWDCYRPQHGGYSNYYRGLPPVVYNPYRLPYAVPAYGIAPIPRTTLYNNGLSRINPYAPYGNFYQPGFGFSLYLGR